ncbi:dipeptidase [Rhizosaccharibacter radicis]|uniref:Dipeptidase n=1 Tax=Rhizosaccharibacter radicis TaxID=2782605 RepID=A0ABT1W2K1_9PROT|nr:dipeptidase [Acetobacteraceae bacterium KSS12]
MSDIHPSSGPTGSLPAGTALARVDAGLDQSLERLFALLRIPSISTQPAHAADCRRTAEWLRDELAGIGLDASVRETPGHPIVVAHDLGAADRPHVLFYGHYDVQPVDPLALWDRPPFEPAIVDGPEGPRIVARGASDDKGQVMTFIEALRALREADGRLPLRVSVLIEGEEECGGPNLRPFLEANAAELGCDVALICDTSMVGRDTPAITASLRGLVGEEIVIQAADRDLHSGMFGNAARNPIAVLADILSSLRTADGGVSLPGFYDGVTVPPDGVRARWREIAGGDEALLGPVGLAEAAGERGFSAVEQTWCRPSCEINGISGGYEGDGFKTVLPAKAMAKVSFRLVAGQDPVRVRASFREHVRARIPADCRVEFHEHGGSAASAVPTDSPMLHAALGALTAEWGVDAAVIGSGGSIPVVRELQETIGVDSLLVGFARDDDRIHSPNEKYDLDSFHRGTRSWVRILHALATAGA